MGGQVDTQSQKHICAGLLAHVDAGKTTLAESILYLTGSIRRLGRVDHRDAFLDTYKLERARGITIFSKQAQLALKDIAVTLLDTPGHVDFSAEMERSLQVLDYAILVINGADGVQGHVETLWRLLARYEIPVFLFVNKMDQAGTDRQQLMAELKQRLDSRCVDFGGDDRGVEKVRAKGGSASEKTNAPGPTFSDFQEELAMCDESLLEKYLEGETIGAEDIRRLIAGRQVFPCYFGSALKLWGVEEFLDGLNLYAVCPSYPAQFGARIYKISRDTQGNRLTHMKITGGSLKVKTMLKGSSAGTEIWEEKVDQIRIYSGSSYETVEEAPAGTICAVTGLSAARCGQGLGIEAAAGPVLLEPVLTYRVELPEGCDVHGMLARLRQLEEEEPQLHIVWNETLGEIHAQVMGDVQIEILKSMIADRFGVEVEFGAGSIVYKETIAAPVEGIGHFEPLRHYAEVHLLLEPGEPGSGLVFDTACSEDILDKNWQRLILTHLEEKQHVGVLTGAPITDMRITLVTGRAHQKHTEGGDFRQATYRAVRQGLMKAHSVLLEPVYGFRLEIPSENLGRAMTDIQRMNGIFQPPQTQGERSILTGSVPAVCMQNYSREVTAYTRGRGHLFCSLKGYEPCHNEEEIVRAAGYDPDADLENPTGSVFCSHGAGYVVPWDQVDAFAHVDSGLFRDARAEAQEEVDSRRVAREPSVSYSAMVQSDKELKEIFERTYGPVKRRWADTVSGSTGGRTDGGAGRPAANKTAAQNTSAKNTSAGKSSSYVPAAEEFLLVDGYNIIFAWDELNELSKTSLEAARGKLMDILSNYQGYRKMTLILVFDAYKVEGGVGEVLKYHNIHVVYTKEAETADQYIEKTVHAIGRRHHVTVATSDALEQVIILGAGARRMSAGELREEIALTEQEIRRDYIGQERGSKNLLIHHASDEVAELMEDVRLGKKSLEED